MLRKILELLKLLNMHTNLLIKYYLTPQSRFFGIVESHILSNSSSA
jgi:hypothetical protein